MATVTSQSQAVGVKLTSHRADDWKERFCLLIIVDCWVARLSEVLHGRGVWMDASAECWGGWRSPETRWQVWSGLFLSFSFGSHRCHDAPPVVWKLPGGGFRKSQLRGWFLLWVHVKGGGHKLHWRSCRNIFFSPPLLCFQRWYNNLTVYLFDYIKLFYFIKSDLYISDVVIPLCGSH